MRQDVNLALRSLRRAPVFALAAIGTLALGIAASTSIFSLFYQVLLRSLPVPSPRQLVILHSGPPGFNGWTSSDNSETVFSYPLYRALRDGDSKFSGLAARSSARVEISLRGGNDSASAEVVSGNFFNVLGLRPQIGRLLSPADDRVRGGNPVAVLSYPYWVEHFGRSMAALNEKILLNGHPFVIVGVTPPEFHGFMVSHDTATYVPIAMKREMSPGWDDFDKVDSHWLNIVARTKDGVSPEQAIASLRPIWTATLRQQVAEMHVAAKGERRLLAKTLDFHSAAKGINNMEADWRKPLTVLLAMVGLLLLIACANVANLLLARGVSRAREMAVRVAIGADRWDVIRQSLSESLVLAAAGGIAGTTLSFWLVGGLIAVLPERLAGHWLSARPDFNVLGFSLLLVLATTLLFGVLPSVHAARIDPMPALRDQSGTASASGARTRWRQALVVAQLAVSVALLVGAGLFVKTLLNLLSHDAGFRPDRLVTFSLDPKVDGYTLERGRALYRAVEDRLRGLPGVESAAIGDDIPLAGSESASNVTVEGFTSHSDEDAISDSNKVGPNYFRTMGTALLAGREFTEQDKAGSTKVVIVNQAFANHFLGGSSAIGKRMKVGAGSDPLNLEIVGEVKDASNMDLRSPVSPMFYLPVEQTYADDKEIPRAAFLLRSRSNPQALERDIRAIVKGLDPKLPVSQIGTMTERVADSVYTERLSATLAMAFGILAMLLAAVGLYGVVAYSVARRIPEIGIRLALGAFPSQVLRLVLQEVALLAAAGIAIGIPVAYALGRLMSTQLYGVKPESVGIFCAATALMFSAALLAGLIPAYRASIVDPKEALRYE